MNFSAWSIRNPIAPLLGFFLLMVLGIQSFNSLPITRFPNIDVAVVSISVTQSGASPSELEMQVTKEIEDAVASINGVDEISSKVNDGVSVTSVVFRIEIPTQQAVQDVKDAVDRIRNDLPAGVDEPIVNKVDVEGQAIQTFAVSAPNMTLEELSWFVDDTIKRAAGPERHWPHRSDRRCRPRNQDRTGPGPAERAGYYRRRRQQAIARHQCRYRLGPGPGGWRRTGDPRAGRYP